MIQQDTLAAEQWWRECSADEWADAVVAAMKLGGVDKLFFVSGSELSFFQESIAKAQERGWPAPQLVTVTHESVALNAGHRLRHGLWPASSLGGSCGCGDVQLRRRPTHRVAWG